jgi:hypothetical protein
VCKLEFAIELISSIINGCVCSNFALALMCITATKSVYLSLISYITWLCTEALKCQQGDWMLALAILYNQTIRLALLAHEKGYAEPAFLWKELTLGADQSVQLLKRG